MGLHALQHCRLSPAERKHANSGLAPPALQSKSKRTRETTAAEPPEAWAGPNTQRKCIRVVPLGVVTGGHSVESWPAMSSWNAHLDRCTGGTGQADTLATKSIRARTANIYRTGKYPTKVVDDDINLRAFLRGLT